MFNIINILYYICIITIELQYTVYLTVISVCFIYIILIIFDKTLIYLTDFIISGCIPTIFFFF